ncbi:MAG: cation diffusion facilitator family transporter [Jiangellaceae bacterium]
MRYAQFTIGYNLIEGIVAVSAGLAASAISPIGFGIDSGIEVVARHRRPLPPGRGDTRRAPRPSQGTPCAAVHPADLFALAAYVTFEGVRDLITGEEPDTSPVGIAITGASIAIMPWLARVKRKTGKAMSSRLVIADAAETRLCAWLSVSTFAGLVGYALAGWTWIDPVAGFVIAAFAITEGKEAWKGDLVHDDHDDHHHDEA